MQSLDHFMSQVNRHGRLQFIRPLFVLAIAAFLSTASSTVAVCQQTTDSQPPAAQDEHPLKGVVWQAIEMTAAGNEVPEDGRKHVRMTFTDDKLIFEGNFGPNSKAECNYEIDDSADPKRIRFEPKADSGRWVRMIYKLDGDTLTVCGGEAAEEGEFPSEFSSTADNKQILIKLQAVVGEAESGEMSPVAGDAFGSLVGKWTATKIVARGRPITGDDMEHLVLMFDEDQMSFVDESGDKKPCVAEHSASTDPKRLHFQPEADSESWIWAIYRIEGDKLIICATDDTEDGSYPTEFESTQENDLFLIEFRKDN
ncbi:MAG: TIGR03067 domain-containing protein [Pirellulaceae bacterium]